MLTNFQVSTDEIYLMDSGAFHVLPFSIVNSNLSNFYTTSHVADEGNFAIDGLFNRMQGEISEFNRYKEKTRHIRELGDLIFMWEESENILLANLGVRIPPGEFLYKCRIEGNEALLLRRIIYEVYSGKSFMLLDESDSSHTIKFFNKAEKIFERLGVSIISDDGAVQIISPSEKEQRVVAFSGFESLFSVFYLEHPKILRKQLRDYGTAVSESDNISSANNQKVILDMLSDSGRILDTSFMNGEYDSINSLMLKRVVGKVMASYSWRNDATIDCIFNDIRNEYGSRLREVFGSKDSAVNYFMNRFDGKSKNTKKFIVNVMNCKYISDANRYANARYLIGTNTDISLIFAASQYPFELPVKILHTDFDIDDSLWLFKSMQNFGYMKTENRIKALNLNKVH
jgi:hypothetical protein